MQDLRQFSGSYRSLWKGPKAFPEVLKIVHKHRTLALANLLQTLLEH